MPITKLPGSNSTTEKKWWQKLKFKKNKPATLITNRSTKTTAQDWRTLSPNEPPLPFLVPSSSSNTAVSRFIHPRSVVVPSSIKSSEADRFASEMAPIFKECQSNTTRLLHHSPSSCSSFSAAIVGRELYTIQESSEASYASTASNSNNNNDNNNNNSNISSKDDSITRNTAPSSLMSTNTTNNVNNFNVNHVFSCNNENKDSDGYETAPSSCLLPLSASPHKFKSIPTIQVVDEEYPESTTTNDYSDQVGTDTNSLTISNVMDQSSPSSQRQSKVILVENNKENFYIPIFEWPTKFAQSVEPHFGTDLIGNEEECRLQFCTLVAQAYQQYRKGRHACPREMFLLFGEKDNIQGITLISRDGKREDYLELGGSPQYIGPELSICPSFNYEQSDIWALGISLYRMLVGKFPFCSNGDHQSHRELFRKMLTSDFVLPKTLSADARDLIRRMLSPENSRASFDLVMFHPWIEPYVYWSDIVVKDHQEQASAAVMSTSGSSGEKTKNKKGRKSHKRMKKAARIIQKVIRTIFKGPYPPPSSYHDLVDSNYRFKK